MAGRRLQILAKLLDPAFLQAQTTNPVTRSVHSALGQLRGYAFQPDSLELVDDPNDRGCRFGWNIGVLHGPVQDFSVVDVDAETIDPECFERIVHGQDDLGVGQDVRAADSVQVELHELAVASGIGFLRSPQPPDLVTAERLG